MRFTRRARWLLWVAVAPAAPLAAHLAWCVAARVVDLVVCW